MQEEGGVGQQGEGAACKQGPKRETAVMRRGTEGQGSRGGAGTCRPRGWSEREV